MYQPVLPLHPLQLYHSSTSEITRVVYRVQRMLGKGGGAERVIHHVYSTSSPVTVLRRYRRDSKGILCYSMCDNTPHPPFPLLQAPVRFPRKDSWISIL